MEPLRLKAHAKINLYLRVGGHLAGGYHSITSVMQSLELCDDVELTRAPALSLRCSVGNLESENNLAYQAAIILQQTTGTTDGADITLTKRIPIAAGLGGGSADAAAALIGLNQLWDLKLSSQRLATLAAKLGADVPFFIYGGTQLVEGYGNVVSPLPDLSLRSDIHVVLATPRAELRSGDIYRQLSHAYARQPTLPAAVLGALKRGNLEDIRGILENSLEEPVVAACPQVANITRLALDFGANGALVSGSGPTVFALTDSEDKALEMAAGLGELCQTTVTRFANRGVTVAQP